MAQILKDLNKDSFSNQALSPQQIMLEGEKAFKARKYELALELYQHARENLEFSLGKRSSRKPLTRKRKRENESKPQISPQEIKEFQSLLAKACVGFARAQLKQDQRSFSENWKNYPAVRDAYQSAILLGEDKEETLLEYTSVALKAYQEKKVVFDPSEIYSLCMKRAGVCFSLLKSGRKVKAVVNLYKTGLEACAEAIAIEQQHPKETRVLAADLDRSEPYWIRVLLNQTRPFPVSEIKADDLMEQLASDLKSAFSKTRDLERKRVCVEGLEKLNSKDPDLAQQKITLRTWIEDAKTLFRGTENLKHKETSIGMLEKLAPNDPDLENFKQQLESLSEQTQAKMEDDKATEEGASTLKMKS